MKDKEKIEVKEKYPKFISNNPCGLDKFEGRSQERLVQAIATHITNNESTDSNENSETGLSKIIGLEGGWGVGKSNVIRQLKNAPGIKDKYYIFEYDAWGHQEDLQRRSFLETLTGELLKERIIENEKKWKGKLENLLAHKRTWSTKTSPKLDAGAAWVLFFFALTSVTFFMANKLDHKDSICTLLLHTLIAFSPILLGIIIWLFKRRKDEEMRSIAWFFQLSKERKTSEGGTETISQKEPTVSDFKEWMSDISKNMNDKKLIIVYDNMDRLPAEKVKQLWSSIHTFFSDETYKNIWTIIPFDRAHLANAFNEQQAKTSRDKKEGKKELTDFFISKTFPIVYRVPLPVMTDAQDFFKELYQEAFGTTEETDREIITRAFRLERPQATARNMIEFINQLVALKNIWNYEIRIKYMAIYLLCENELTNENVDSNILSHSFLSQQLKKLVTQNRELQTNIATLTYGVPRDKAEQIPLRNYINACFAHSDNQNYDLNKYAELDIFPKVLLETIDHADEAETESIIQSMSRLDRDKLNDPESKITSAWNKIATRLKKHEFTEQELFDKYKQVLANTDSEIKTDFAKYLCRQVQNFDQKNFSGSHYYIFLEKLEEIIDNLDINMNLVDSLYELSVHPNIFINYLGQARENYLNYKLTANPLGLNNFLGTLQFEGGSWFSEEPKEGRTQRYSQNIIRNTVTTLLKSEEYQLDKLKTNLEEKIPQTINSVFFQYMDIYKLMLEDKPMEIKLTKEQIDELLNIDEIENNTTHYNELITIVLSHNESLFSLPNTMKFDEDQINLIAGNLEYYQTVGALLTTHASNNTPLLNKILQYMIKNRIGEILDISDVLKRHQTIIDLLDINEEDLLKYLDDWQITESEINTENLLEVIPNSDFYIHTVNIENDLTTLINKVTIEALSLIDDQQLTEDFKTANKYWPNVFNILHGAGEITELPDNLNNVAKEFLTQIASSGMEVPKKDSPVYKLVKMVDKPEIAITDIINQTCNATANYKMTAEKFLFLHTWFESNNIYKERSGDVAQYILGQIGNNIDCLKKITDNKELYKDIIDKAGSQASTFKEKLQTVINKESDPQIIDFAILIGLEPKTSKTE